MRRWMLYFPTYTSFITFQPTLDSPDRVIWIKPAVMFIYEKFHAAKSKTLLTTYYTNATADISPAKNKLTQFCTAVLSDELKVQNE